MSSVAFHPAGNLVAAFVRDGAVRFWDLTTAKEAFCFQLPPGNTYGSDSGVAFSSRGNLLAASGGSNNSFTFGTSNAEPKSRCCRGTAASSLMFVSARMVRGLRQPDRIERFESGTFSRWSRPRCLKGIPARYMPWP